MCINKYTHKQMCIHLLRTTTIITSWLYGLSWSFKTQFSKSVSMLKSYHVSSYVSLPGSGSAVGWAVIHLQRFVEPGSVAPTRFSPSATQNCDKTNSTGNKLRQRVKLVPQKKVTACRRDGCCLSGWHGGKKHSLVAAGLLNCIRGFKVY